MLEALETEDQHEIEIKVEKTSDNSTLMDVVDVEVSDDDTVALYLVVISIVLLVVMLNILSPCNVLSRKLDDERVPQIVSV